MKAIVAAIGFCLFSLASIVAHGENAPDTAMVAKPMTYALFAAMGDQFTYMIEVRRTGSHLPPYRTESVTEPDNLLNMYVLRSLDKAVAATDPDSKRVLLNASRHANGRGFAARSRRRGTRAGLGGAEEYAAAAGMGPDRDCNTGVQVV
jgi:hypothetical protein